MQKLPKTIIGLVILAVIGLGGGVGLKRWQAISKDREIKKQFAWGVSALTFPFPTYIEKFSTQDQMQSAKKMGVGYVRMDYIPTNPKATDAMIQGAISADLTPVLIIPFGPNDIFKDKALEANTQKYVGDIVKRYKDQVKYFQLATEVASVALANDPSKHGIEVKEYPADRLRAVTTWVKTAEATVKDIAPAAQTIINDQWVHTGFFDNYFANGGQTDILGWNWFSDMGKDMNAPVIDASKQQTYALMTKLKSYNKPIWLTEVSRRLGSQGNNGASAELEQADFLTMMAEYVKTEPSIKGFFVYNLLEDQAAPIQERGYSLIKAHDDNGKSQKITGEKLAYERYRQIIKKAR